ncbi:MAG: VanW family protein [Nocardioidaceae bacterium]|nr:VanW family protein [Nocardioidaceae bacterium]
MSQPDLRPGDDTSGPDTGRAERRGAWLAAGGVVVLLVGGYTAAVVAVSDRVPGGTAVADVGIGGLSVAAAEDKLRSQLVPLADRPIEVEVAERTYRLDPADLGLSLDVEATVARAHGGARVDPRVLWDALAGGDDVAPVVDVDQDLVIGAVRDLADETDRAGVEPAVTFSAQGAQPQPPAAGHALDTTGAIITILDSWLVDNGPIVLPTESVRPAVGRKDLAQVVERVAEPAVAAPVALEVGGLSWRLSPQRYAPALRMEVRRGELVLVADQERLAARVPRLIDRAGVSPRNATVRLAGGEPVVVRSRPGVRVTADDLSAGLLRALQHDDRRARLAGVTQPPEVTTQQAREWRIRERISSFTTYYPHEDYRNTNIGRAAELINGTVLAPGETFSLNGTVGERTAANGFTIGYVISDGVFAEDYGGGVSQVATTTFNAAFFAGLEDVEHQPHSFYIDRYPMGREATVAWPTLDLRFRNTTPYGVLVQAWIKPSSPGSTGEMHVVMWSTKYWEIEARASQPYAYTQPSTRVIDDPGCVPTTGYSGFDIDVFRDFYRGDDLVRTETMHTTYTPADTVICR